jgi:hypothetical protein
VLARPTDGALHTLDLQFGSQFDLLPIHAFRENDGDLAELARMRLARIEIPSCSHATIHTLCVDAEHPRHSGNPIITTPKISSIVS